MLTGPVLAGVAAWEGARWSHTRSMLIVSERLAGAVVQYVAAMVMWMLTLHAAAIATLAAAVALGPVDRPPPVGAVLAMPPLLALLTAEIAAGFVAGWWVRRSYCAPLVAVGVFIVTLVGYGAEPGLFIEIGGATSSLLGLAPRRSVQLAQAAWWLAVAVGLVGAAVLVADRRSRGARVAVATSALTAAAVAVVVVSLGFARFRTVPVAVECAGDRPQICLADGYHDLRPELDARLRPAWAALTDAGVPVPARVTQETTAGGDVATIGGVASISTTELTAMVVGAIMPGDCDLYASPQLLAAFTDVSFWISRTLGADPYDPTVSSVLAAGESAAARDLVRRQVDTLAACAI
jgi:hypothetical protein